MKWSQVTLDTQISEKQDGHNRSVSHHTHNQQPTFGLLLKGQAQSSNAVVVLLPFLLEGQKELHDGVKSSWSGQRG